RSSKIGFTSYPFPAWKLAPESSLHLWLKIEGNDWDSKERFRLTIRDLENNNAGFDLERSQFRSGDWVQLEIPLSSMKGIDSVNLKELNELYLDTKMPPSAVVKFDDIYFHIPSKTGSVFGVTDKPIAQRILEARLSKNLRAFSAYSEIAQEEKPPVL